MCNSPKASLASRLPRSVDTSTAKDANFYYYLTPQEQQIADTLGISTELYEKIRDIKINSDDSESNLQQQAVSKSTMRTSYQQQ